MDQGISGSRPVGAAANTDIDRQLYAYNYVATSDGGQHIPQMIDPKRSLMRTIPHHAC
jgi:hypothetical protein